MQENKEMWQDFLNVCINAEPKFNLTWPSILRYTEHENLKPQHFS